MAFTVGNSNKNKKTSAPVPYAPTPATSPAPPTSLDALQPHDPSAPSRSDTKTSLNSGGPDSVNEHKQSNERSELHDDDRKAGEPAAERANGAGVEEVAAKPTATAVPLVNSDLAEEIARKAVQVELARQAEKARFDVSEGNRVVLVLDPAVLRSYTIEWSAYNSTANEKLNFTQYLTNRLRACQSHTSTRPIYVDDSLRQQLEELFNEAVTSPDDLRNKIDRHIRPIIESEDLPDGVLRLKALDPAFVEMVSGWEPDKTVGEAVGDFILEAAYEKAGRL